VNDSAKNQLLLLARQTLDCYLTTEQIPGYRTEHPELLSRQGAFVTLHKGVELRGCIGHLTPRDPLFLTVQQCAVSAAREDSRFLPVKSEELPDISIEISVLAPLQGIRDPLQVKVGEHGLMISRGQRRGLLLPQVATENRWDRGTFLAQACRKAGLPEFAWRDPATRIEVFTAYVFSEHF
jgi:AmmeMemoRadiSam system protein A